MIRLKAAAYHTRIKATAAAQLVTRHRDDESCRPSPRCKNVLALIRVNKTLRLD
jgi:hypothetical protein